MAWFADLAGRAESLLNNIDEQTGAAIRNQGVPKKKAEKQDFSIQAVQSNDFNKRKPINRPWRKKPLESPESKFIATNLSRRTPSHLTARSIIKPQSDGPKKPFLRKGSSQMTNASMRASQLNDAQVYYNLNNCPKTMMDDDDELLLKSFGKQRRYSLPTDDLQDEEIPYRMQNLEIENAMLKNELHVVNKEVSELLERLRKAEEELSRSFTNNENLQSMNDKLKHDNDSLNKHVDKLKASINDCNNMDVKAKKHINELETQVSIYKDTIKALEEKVEDLNGQKNESVGHNIKTENELQRAQDVIIELESNLKKTHAECTRLEHDWESYKVRVNNMLKAKDCEIKDLQAGINLTEDTKILMEQLDCLKEERDKLSNWIGQIREQCSDMRDCMEQLENRSSSAERLVIALREALREERQIKMTLETECITLTKQLKTLQQETGQTMATLHAELREREEEINRCREIDPTSVGSMSSALNVADYDSVKEADHDKLVYLTQSLISRQVRIDGLLADKNQLKIQLERLESKYKMDIARLQSAVSDQGILNYADGAAVRRGMIRRLRIFIRRNILIKSILFIYMICLHFLVSIVLFTNNPDIFNFMMKEGKEDENID